MDKEKSLKLVVRSSTTKPRLLSMLEKHKLINQYIREGKDLKELRDKGIVFKLPI